MSLWIARLGESLAALARGERFKLLSLPLAALTLLALAQAAGLVRPLDDGLAGVRAHLVSRAPSDQITIVEIDTRSVRAAGEWPWPRANYARAIQNLRAAGATIIGFDVDFSARSGASDDAALQAAIDADPGSIVLPVFVQPDSGEENSPLAALSRNSVFGGVNIPVDQDGQVRRYMRGFVHGTHYHAALAAVLAGAPYGQTAPFLIDYGVRADEITRLSFEDVRAGRFDPALVRGRAILVGATALELGDEFATPVRPVMPGVLIHALAFEGLVQGRALFALSDWIVLVAAGLVLAALWPRARPIELRAFLVRHGAMLSLLILTPLALQAVAPVSAELGLAVLAQGICFGAALRRELTRRAEALRRQREEHLTYVALHDPETQLPNRRAMLEEVAARLATAGEGRVIVAVALGVDRFPTLRGAIGYANANALVRGLARHVATCSGEEKVFHISTSILGVVLTAPDQETARTMCAAGMARLKTNVFVDGWEIDAGVRAGVAVMDGPTASPEKLLERAAIALDQARLQNRRYLRFDDLESVDPKAQLALMSDVGKGLKRGEFRLHYQAKADARSGAIIGAEALMRWTHPIQGEVSPDRFIAIAEETGAIDDMTRWALDQAIADQRAMRARGLDMSLAVNLSGRVLTDAAFCADAVRAIEAAGARICFEITETAVIGDPLAAISAIQAFHEAGVRISVDDYGSGLSSLAYLKQLAADELKLDKSLIRDIKSSARDRLILKSTIDLAHGLCMSIVAEGVEDETTRATLAGMGCDYLQGYLIARPLPFEAFIALCQEHAGAADLGGPVSYGQTGT